MIARFRCCEMWLPRRILPRDFAALAGRYSLGACLGERGWSERTCSASTERYLWTGSGHREHAASDARVLVVGNPCNTNCLIAMNNGKDVPSDRWFAMTRLDENRAKTQLALKAGSHWRHVSNMAIWGNHSSTLYPDFFNARIEGKPATEVIEDSAMARDRLHQSGSAARRGGHSGARRFFGKIGGARRDRIVQSILNATPGDDWHSLAVCSDGVMGSRKALFARFRRGRMAEKSRSYRMCLSTSSPRRELRRPSTN